MKRYHIKVYRPEGDRARLEALTAELNRLTWQASGHCLDNLKYRAIDTRAILSFVNGLTLQASDIFEYYTEDSGRIVKACYRVKYSAGLDLILIVSNSKKLVTLYTNTADDRHETLDASLYMKL